METVLITGGTGIIGTAIGQALLQKGYRVIILSREAEKKQAVPGLSFALWNVKKQTIDKQAIVAADHIIHLAGASVAEKRWTKKRKQEIIDSRVKSSQLLIDSLRTIPNKVKTFVSASAIGWYGEDPVVPNPDPFKEDAPADSSFLGEVCRLWEASTEPVKELGIRLVKFRIGMVISKEGGFIEAFSKPLKWGMATILGNGRQVISWVHIDDLVNMFIRSIDDNKMSGVYNAVAPQPVTNKQLVLTLARHRKKFFIPVYVPSFVLKLALGKMSTEILKSATVSSEKIKEAGYSFDFPSIDTAIQQKNA